MGFCSNCGSKLKPNAKFCGQCGKSQVVSAVSDIQNNSNIPTLPNMQNAANIQNMPSMQSTANMQTAPGMQNNPNMPIAPVTYEPDDEGTVILSDKYLKLHGKLKDDAKVAEANNNVVPPVNPNSINQGPTVNKDNIGNKEPNNKEISNRETINKETINKEIVNKELINNKVVVNTPPKKGGKGIIIILIIIIILAALAAVYFFVKPVNKKVNEILGIEKSSDKDKENDDNGSNVDENADNNGKGKQDADSVPNVKEEPPVIESEPEPEPEPVPTGNVVAYARSASDPGMNAPADSKIEGIKVTLFDENGTEIASDYTDSNGKVTFPGVEFGNYTVQYSSDIYNSTTESVVLEGDEAVANTYMVIVPEENCAVVFVRWNADTDVDVCAFNSETKENIHVASSGKKVKNVNPGSDGTCIFYDDQNSYKCELLYFRGIESDAAKTVYILDYTAALSGTESSMEALGVSIDVYTRDGLVYSTTLSEDENAALCTVGYFYQGQWGEYKEYTNDLSDSKYKWALREKE